MSLNKLKAPEKGMHTRESISKIKNINNFFPNNGKRTSENHKPNHLPYRP